MGSCCLHSQLRSVLCDDLEGWDLRGVGGVGLVRGASKREGIYVPILYIVVPHKLT